MKRAFLIVLVCVLQASAADSPPPLFGDGTFVGMEPMPGYHDRPKDHWFHQNTLTIKDSVVTLNKIPVVYHRGERSYSASDGGFYTYHGTVGFADGAWHIELLRTESDYAAVRIDKNGRPIPAKPERFTITKLADSSLRIGEVTYRRPKSK